MHKSTQKISTADHPAETSKDWLVVVMLVIFVVLYALAFAGKLDPFKDNSMLLRFEPVIFVLVGYYFGRLPFRQSERSFRDEIARQSLRADAAQRIKEKVEQEREILEERIRNARTLLETDRRGVRAEGSRTSSSAIETAIKVLSS